MEKCSTCLQSFSVRNIPNNVIKCSFCGKYFHGGCQNIFDAGVVQYIRSGVQNVFNCLLCEAKREIMLSFVHKFDELKNLYCGQEKVLVELSNLVKKQGEDVNNLRLEMKNVPKTNVNTNTPKRTFASLLGTDQPVFSPLVKKVKTNKSAKHRKKENNHMIVIQHKLGDLEADKAVEIEESIKKVLNPLKDPVFGMRKTSKNKVVLNCKDESAFHTYKERISSILGTAYEVNKPRERKYILKCVGVPESIDKAQILTCIGEQNNCMDLIKNLSVKRTAVNIAYIECDNEDTYTLLLSKKKVFVMWNVVHIQPYVNLLRCYNCQKFGHTYGECDIGAKRVCPKCSGEHDLIQCESDVVCCINCQRENNSTGSSNPTDHFAWSSKCPIVHKEFKKLEAKNKA